MANLSGSERVNYVREMFSEIAPRYDLMNRLMTFGQDVRWRSLVIRRAEIPHTGRLLDLGAGTGDLAREAMRQYPECAPLAADFTLEMMQAGRSRRAASQFPDWCAADAARLPFMDESFDAVVSGFLMRNLPEVRVSLSEQHRVLKPGGRIVILDTTPPSRQIYAPLVRFHMFRVIPALGEIITGSPAAYTYLPESTDRFLEPERLAQRIIEAGFREVAFQRGMFGTVAIHWGVK
jgi:demethylmenaquinone methyltransferase/2-methoxy-6-polyprenyl-1,4-benzoquinol methylase